MIQIYSDYTEINIKDSKLEITVTVVTVIS